MLPGKESHIFLVEAEDEAQGIQQVQHFLQSTQLIQCADFVVVNEDICAATQEIFIDLLQQKETENMKFAASQLTTLRDEGISTLEDLLTMKEGYLTKVLHTLSHILDGFIGVDSVMYNLVEDSHRVSSTLQEVISSQPERYWLIPIRTGSASSSVFHT